MTTPRRRRPPEDDGGNILGNLVGNVGEIIGGLGQLVGAGVSDLYRAGALAITGGSYTGGEDRPQGQFSLDDIFINMTGWDPGDPVRSRETDSAFVQDLVHRYGPLFKGDLATFGERVHEDPGFFLLDALGAGSLVGKGAGAVGRSALRSRTAVPGRIGEVARGGLTLAEEAGRRTRPAVMGATLDDLLEAGAQLGPVESLASRVLPRARPTVLPAGGGATTIEQVIPSFNPVRRALASPIRRAMTEPLDRLETRVGQLEALRSAGEPLARADQAWLDTVGKTVREARTAGATRTYRPVVTGRLLRNSVNKLVGTHSAEWLARRQEDLRAVQDITRPVVEEGLADVAHGAAQGLDAADDIGRLLEGAAPEGIPGGSGAARTGVQTAQAVRPGRTEPLAAFEALEAAEEGSLAARVRNVARPTHEHYVRLLGDPGADPRMIDLTRRRLDSLLEPLRLEERAKRGEAVSTIERWREDMRLFIAERWENPQIEAGLFAPGELFERAYLPLRHRFGAKFDRAAGEFAGGPEVTALDDAMKATGRGAPIYFPHIDATRLQLRDFLMSRGRIGARKATADPHLKRNTAELLDQDIYVKDPVQAYQRRAARAVRAEETARFVQKVAEVYGRRIGPKDQLAAGEVVWAPDGLLRFFRTQVKLEDEIADLMKAGMSQDDALAGALREVVSRNLDEVRHVLGDQAGDVARQGVGVTRKGLDLYAVPETVAKQIEDFTKWRLGRNTRLFWDGPVNLWRSFVLLGSPRWIVNNFLGNIVFQKLQGGRFRDIVAQLDKDYRATLRSLPGFEDVEKGLYGPQSQYVEKLGSAAREGVGAAVEAMKGTRAYRTVKTWGDASRQLNAVAEDAFRRSSFVTALERQQIGSGIRRVGRVFWGSKRRLEDIARRGATPAMIREALEEVNRFFGDYKNLGPIERGIIRRFILPFYGFYKHTVKLAASMPVDAPGRTIALRGLADASREFQEDLGPMPPWLEESGFPLGPGEGGAEEFLLTGGANPLGFVGDLLRDPFHTVVSAGPPQTRVGIEQATGRSTFTGQPFSAEDVATPFGSDQPFRIDPETGQVLGPLDRHQAPGLLEHALQQVPQYELVKDLLAGGATYDAASLPDIVTGGGVLRDDATGEPLYPDDPFERILRMFGVSTMDYDLDRYQEGLAEDEQAALREALRRRAAGGRPLPTASGGGGSAFDSL